MIPKLQNTKGDLTLQSRLISLKQVSQMQTTQLTTQRSLKK
jgi:hypothetical protein